MANNLHHVALIPDGTRRWARNNGVRLTDAYEAVARALVRTGTTLFSHDLSSVSIYALSAANLRRGPDELLITFAAHTKVISGALLGACPRNSLSPDFSLAF